MQDASIAEPEETEQAEAPAQPEASNVTSLSPSEEEASQDDQSLGGMDAQERIPSSESTDDLLDIPAFLRRQAN